MSLTPPVSTHSAMLDERWRQIVADHPNETAIVDAATRRAWTFAGLAGAADAEAFRGHRAVVHPAGGGVNFILALLRDWRAGRVACPLEPDQPVPRLTEPPVGVAHLKITSGTTGAPRAVAFTAAQLAADSAAIVAAMGMRPEWPNLGVISLAHSYGFSNLVLPLLLHGIPLICAPSHLPAALADAARGLGDTPLTLAAVPALWRTWHEADAIPPRVRLAVSAGAPLPLALERAVFETGGLKLHNFLGATECGGIAYDNTAVPRADGSLVGCPLPGVRVARGCDGCLVVRGPAVGESYWPEPDERLRNGTYRSCDLVELTPEAEVLLRGRAGEIINVAGRKVAPESVEEILRRHPGVRECLVLGLPSADERGDTLAAIVEADAALTEPVLREFALTWLPPWQAPRVWRFVESLAANGRGKLSRAEWRHRVQAGSSPL